MLSLINLLTKLTTGQAYTLTIIYNAYMHKTYSDILITEMILIATTTGHWYMLVKASVRVHYGKYCTRSVSRGQIQHEPLKGKYSTRLCLVLYLPSQHAPRAIFPVVHECNRCFYWFIVLWFPLKHALLCECMCISHSYLVPIPQLQYSTAQLVLNIGRG